MKLFVSENVHDKEIIDTVFEASQSAVEATRKYGADNVVNGAFGTFFDESGKLLAFDTVYRAFDRVDDIQKSKYASSIDGSPEFIAAVKDWLLRSVGVDIDCNVIATPGGTGALSSTIRNTLKAGQKVIQPDIGWGPYTTIARENHTPIVNYTLFDEKNTFNVQSFRETCEALMKEQGKVVVFINDPCQNPTGYTMTEDEWSAVLEDVKALSEKGPVILVVDIAYIDFNEHGDAYKKMFRRFSGLGNNVMTVICFSISKSLTAYGMRVGAQVLISDNTEQREKLRHACGNTARGTWSTVNNGGMKVFADIALNPELKAEYMKEKDVYVELLRQRAEIFVRETKDVGLPIYPYREGFFVTIKIDNQVVKNELHLKLKTMNIFFVNVYGGLRVAICSIQKKKLHGLAKRVKEALDELLEIHTQS